MPDNTLFKKKNFTLIILKWGKYNKEKYPWRATKNSYIILISEILLRKTTRIQVNNIFKVFFNKFPTIDVLASSSEIQIKHTIKPLGIEHKRSIGLKNLALCIINEYSGKIPKNKKQLLMLPNIGEYTANAYLCLKFNQNFPMLDTNTIRILTRYFSLKSNKRNPVSDPVFWDFLTSLIPLHKSKIFNLALLDFASSICTCKKPRCSRCPLNSLCDYYLIESYN